MRWLPGQRPQRRAPPPCRPASIAAGSRSCPRSRPRRGRRRPPAASGRRSAPAPGRTVRHPAPAGSRTARPARRRPARCRTPRNAGHACAVHAMAAPASPADVARSSHRTGVACGRVASSRAMSAAKLPPRLPATRKVMPDHRARPATTATNQPAPAASAATAVAAGTRPACCSQVDRHHTASAACKASHWRASGSSPRRHQSSGWTASRNRTAAPAPSSTRSQVRGKSAMSATQSATSSAEAA